MSHSKTLLQRFEERYTPEPNTGCWLWLGCISGDGYGGFLFPQGRIAHRASWYIHHGAIPAGLFVLHRCDVRACVNPAHLFLGTNADNIADMMSKSREARGERKASARLTSRDVLRMRAEFQAGKSIAALSRRFGLGATATRRAVLGETWRHLAAEITS